MVFYDYIHKSGNVISWHRFHLFIYLLPRRMPVFYIFVLFMVVCGERNSLALSPLPFHNLIASLLMARLTSEHMFVFSDIM